MQWYSVKKDGLPKEEGHYLVVVQTFRDGLVNQRIDTAMEFKKRRLCELPLD